MDTVQRSEGDIQRFLKNNYLWYFIHIISINIFFWFLQIIWKDPPLFGDISMTFLLTRPSVLAFNFDFFLWNMLKISLTLWIFTTTDFNFYKYVLYDLVPLLIICYFFDFQFICMPRGCNSQSCAERVGDKLLVLSFPSWDTV